MSEINVPLVRAVLQQIERAPRRWTQNIWLDRPYEEAQQAPTDTVDNCETTGCFAGWATVLAGYKTDRVGRLHERMIPSPVRERIAETFDLEDDSQFYGAGEGSHMARYYGEYGVKHVAAVELGLEEWQAEKLFDGGNRLRRIYELLAEWTDGEITVPENLPEWADVEPDDLEMWWHDRDVEAGRDQPAEQQGI